MLRTLAEWQEHVYNGGKADPIDILEDWEGNVSDLLDACKSLYDISLDGMTVDYDYMTQELEKARKVIKENEKDSRR